MKFTKIALPILSALMCLTSVAAKKKKEKSWRKSGQFKKETRVCINDVARGKVANARKQVSWLKKTYPERAEPWFLQAIVECAEKSPEKAYESIKIALEKGLPVERLLAGPRNLLKPLYDYEKFQRLPQIQKVKLLHGPVLGAVTDNSARFWLRTAKESKVEIILFSAIGEIATREKGNTSKENDYTINLEIKGLSADKSYSYQLLVDGEIQRLPFRTYFKTMPASGKMAKFSIGFGGGAGFNPQYERMWNTISSYNFPAFLLLGDNVYVDAPEIPETQKYCYYRRQSREEYRKFSAKSAVYAIYDDHDFGDNDCKSTLDIDKPAWKLPVLKVFKDNFVNPYYGGGEKNPGCFFDFSMGDVDIFMLDCRFYREDPAKINSPSMLGPGQKKWLKEKLNNSKATFKIIASSVPWAFGTKPGSKDTWDGHPEEREEIFSFIEKENVEGVVLISADRHRSDAWKVERENGYDLYDFMSSRLTNIHTHPVMPKSIFGYSKKCSFGVLDIDTTKKDPELTYKIISIDNEEIWKMTLKRSQLKK